MTPAACNQDLFDAMDWGRTALGPVSTWPVEMQAIVRTVLASGFPMCTGWGRQAVQIYNDAYNPIYGAKHPQSFGRPVVESWPEIWGFLEPAIEKVRRTRTAMSFEGMLLPLAKQGVPQECYFDFSYSPVTAGPDREVIGVLSVAVERTAETVFRRRQRCYALTLDPQGETALLAVSRSLHEVLAANEMDAAAAVLLAVDRHTQGPGEVMWNLRGHVGLADELRRRLTDDEPMPVSAIDAGGMELPPESASRACVLRIAGRSGELCAYLVLVPHALVPADSHRAFARALVDRLHATLHYHEAQAGALGEARRELQERDTLYRFLFENIGDAAFYGATDGGPDSEEVVLAANPQACAMLGYRPDELIGLRREALFFPDDAQLAAAVRERATRRSFVGDLVLRAKDGRALPVEISSRLVTLPDGGTRSVSLVRDIALRLQREHERTERVRFDTMAHLTGGIAHDFNNLLTVIIGNLETLRLHLPSATPDAGLIADALLGAERMAGLTGQLLSYSRRQRLQPRTVDLNVFIHEMQGLIQSSLGEINRLLLEPAPEPALCQVDPAQLTTAVLNLAANARDAMPGGGVLRLSVHHQTPSRETAAAAATGFVVLRAQDTGVGMADDVLARIFEPFFTTKDVGRGSGLGLSMVQGLMRQSGGDVQVVSAPGQGTRFDLLFPCADRAEVITQVEAMADTLQGRIILLAEDNDLVREQVRRVLMEAGCTVIEARDAREAMAQFERHEGEIDLLLTDLMMPGGMSGLELADTVHRQRPLLPVLIMSGYSPSPDRPDKPPGRFEVLAKPFGGKDLLAALRRQLQR